MTMQEILREILLLVSPFSFQPLLVKGGVPNSMVSGEVKREAV